MNTQPPTILIVDDEPLVARSLARYLRRSGTVTVIHPRDAIAYLEENRPDLAILDFTGHPVQEWIALVNPAPSIVFTGQDPTPDVPAAFAVVTKTDLPGLRAAVSRAL